MSERMSRSEARKFNRDLAKARKLEPGLSRMELFQRKRFEASNSGELLSLGAIDSKSFCRIAYRLCPDMKNPYKLLDACLTCPSYRQAKVDRDFERTILGI